MVMQKALGRRLRDLAGGAAKLHIGFCEKPVRQVRDVVSLPEGWHANHDLVEAVVKILAKPALLHLSLEGDIGGGDDPNVHMERLLAAKRLHLPFLQHAQELRLRGEGKIDNLVEKEASALCKLESPLLSLICAGERAFLVAEEFRLDQGIWDRAAVDGDKRLFASGTQLMDRPSNKFLASAGRALDEGRERGVGYLPDLLNNLLHLLTRTHQPLQRALDNPGCLPQLARALLDCSLQFVGAALQRQLLLPDPATQLARLNRPAHRRNKVIPVDRFLDEVVGSSAEGKNRQRMLAVSGDHYGGRVGH